VERDGLLNEGTKRDSFWSRLVKHDTNRAVSTIRRFFSMPRDAVSAPVTARPAYRVSGQGELPSSQ
jgi:hypothetical protein